MRPDSQSWLSRWFALCFACAVAIACVAVGVSNARADSGAKLKPSQLHLDHGKTTLSWAGQTVVGPAGQCDLASATPFAVTIALSADANGDAVLHLDRAQTVRQEFAISASSATKLVLAFAGQTTANYVAQPYTLTGYGTTFTGTFRSRSGACTYTTPETLALSGSGLSIVPGAVPSAPASSGSAATAAPAPASTATTSPPGSTGVATALWVVLGAAMLALTAVIAAAAWQLEFFARRPRWLRLPR